MSEEKNDEFDDGRGLEAGGHERWVNFCDCVHPIVLGVVVYSTQCTRIQL